MTENRLSSSDFTPVPTEPETRLDWQTLCHVMLKRALPINPLSTQPDDEGENLSQMLISLESVENKPQKWKNRVIKAQLSSISPLNSPNQGQTFYHQESFFETVLTQPSARDISQKIAIIGEFGTGKTLMMQQLAYWLLEKTDQLPIWISPGQLKKNTLRQYLREKWLKQALGKDKTAEISTDEKILWENLLKSGRIWLLIDGIDQLCLEKTYHLPISPLAGLIEQLQGWADEINLLISCRTTTWQAAQQNCTYSECTTLSHFELYRTRAYTYPDEVEQFIRAWFCPRYLSARQQQQGQELAEQLCKALSHAGKERLQQTVTTPLKLALLCRQWQQQPGYLPDTKAQLYQLLVTAFYQWKAETLAVTPHQMEKLNIVLGKLALKGLETGNNLGLLSPAVIDEVLKNDRPLLRILTQLGWLQPMGIVGEAPEDKQYGFCDSTFQAYFAACAIADWQIFMGNPASATEAYRIFDPQWQEVILMWLGRNEITNPKKEAFLQSLVTFEDGCGAFNIYGKRAMFLAGLAVGEFPQSSHLPTIFTQLFQWGFRQERNGDPLSETAKTILKQTYRPQVITHLIEVIRTTTDVDTRTAGFHCLEKIAYQNREAIASLSQWLDSCPNDPLRWQIAVTLGKIDPNNAKALLCFLPLLETGHSDELMQVAFKAIAKIGKGYPKAVHALIRLLHRHPSASLQRRVFQCLETIGKGNAVAIAALVQLIRTQTDASIRRQAAESLEKIDPCNPTAIAVLVQLLQTTPHEDIRRQAVYSLGEIDPQNPEAVQALVKLLKSTPNLMTRWVAISSLGKIGANNREAIETLVQLMQTSEEILLRKEAIESLGKIDPTNPALITALVNLMQSTDDEAIRREAAEALGKFDPGNPEAITALTHLLHNAGDDEFTQRQAAVSLGKIDPGNLEALTALVQLIKSSPKPDIQSLAADSLGEIGNQNPAVIATLIRLLKTTQDKDTFQRTARSLGKIGDGNREAVATFVSLLQTPQEEANRLQIADSLLAILPSQQMPQIVTQLQEMLAHKQTPADLAIQKILYACAQTLPYPEFYQAWHQRIASDNKGLSASAFAGELPHDSPFCHQLHYLVENNPSLPDSIQLVCIDSGEFLDPHNPMIDIYDQMLAQNCPEFSHGIPETPSKLRLYWKLIARNHPDVHFVFVFYENLTNSQAEGFSNEFLANLSKFQGLICLVSDKPIVRLQRFSPKDPQLLEKIITWIEQAVTLTSEQ